ncbi:unnamed protein product [Mytilus coruscus]|uniref:DUF5641 domain-containing protein n=1 Tax=Mytilus coruscus TaxID=42192 RepID=A0A6J8BGE8_MYTCO|nr:unnamed protein product [Mytilus coruscus]
MFVSSYRIAANHIFPSLEDQLRNRINYDFSERTIDDENEPSKEDKQFLDIVSKSTSFVNGHYVIDMPFKSEDVQMPNNSKQAEQRLIALSKRFTRDHDFHKQYVTIMDKVINESYAQGVSEKLMHKMMVISVSSKHEAVALINDIQNLLKQGGFHIAKWISNDRDVVNYVPIEEQAKEIKDLDLNQDSLPIYRALGVQWCVDYYEFRFKIDVKDKPATRRGMLSMTSGVFDPLGFLAPFTLVRKGTLQELCKLDVGWDDAIQQALFEKRTQWLCNLEKLSEFRVNRCLKPSGFGKLISADLHHFADASEIGYDVVSYLHIENEEGNTYCLFIMGKSRVTPLKQVTIPRLELTVATVAVRTNKMILSELEIPVQRSYFWTDSMTVLRYIKITTSRFHTFVANRLAVIHEGSNICDCRYINSKLNPADLVSRGVSAEGLLRMDQWIVPPDFLLKAKNEWPNSLNYDSDIIESILNSRPITRNTDSHRDLEPLTPNHLLLMKQKPNLPPGVFSKTDNYCRRRWRQIQYMTNLFWQRWIREYLPLLQERQKLHEIKRNLQIGDVVLVVDSNATRNSWPMGIIVETILDRAGLIR